VSALLGYHLYLRARLRRDPGYTIQSINNEARVSWVMNIMTGQGKDILAVQTLRNSTMAATFLASTSILLIFGVLNLLQHGTELHAVFGKLQQKSSVGDGLAEIKLLLLLVDFFTAFFSFSLAVRMYNHVGYLINSSSDRGLCPAPSYVAHLLNDSGGYYSWGMRAYYVSVPLVFWLFGPYYLVAASFGLVAVLYHIDRAPGLGQHQAVVGPMGSEGPVPEQPTAPAQGSRSLGTYSQAASNTPILKERMT